MCCVVVVVVRMQMKVDLQVCVVVVRIRMKMEHQEPPICGPLYVEEQAETNALCVHIGLRPLGIILSIGVVLLS